MKRKIITISLVAVSIISLTFLYSTGWLSHAKPWQTATGWNTIPLINRPVELFANMENNPVANQKSIMKKEIYWLGHSGFLIEWDGIRIVTDPILSNRCTVSKRSMKSYAAAEDLGKIDLCLISHAHYDHLDLPTLAAIPSLNTLIVPKGSEKYLSGTISNQTSIKPLDIYQSFQFDKLTITAVPAKHNGGRNHPFTSNAIAVGYIIKSKDFCVYFAGDTAFTSEFETIASNFHPDVAILPIGGFSPRFPLKNYHLSPEEAVRAGLQLDVSAIIPCHFGTFRVSLDHPSTALPRFAEACKKKYINWIMPPVFKPQQQDKISGFASASESVPTSVPTRKF